MNLVAADFSPRMPGWSRPEARRLKPAAIAVFLALLSPLSTQAQPSSAEKIDTLVKDALRQWRVPGLAVAVVQGDRLIYLQGHGVKELGRPGAVSGDTVFPIASCTKPFTSLAVAMLVSGGKMAWDDPVKRHIPFFRLSDPLADVNVTVRDLLAHRTGIGGHDLLWYKSPWSLEERIRKIGLVELDDPFRACFHYQAILYGAAGYAAGRANGSDWADLVQRRILDVLEMKASAPVFRAGGNMAVPHRKNADGKITTIERYPLDKADPAGSLHASVRDLSRFLRFQLGDGAWEGRRLVRAETLAETQRAQMVVPMDGFAASMNPETVQVSYCLGWILQDYRGRRLLQHGGAIDGFRAHLTLVPDAKIGIALLNNLDRGFMNLALSNTIVDQLLGLPFREWNSYYQDLQAKDEAQEKERARLLRQARKAGTKPSLGLEAYAGSYHEPAYGTCRVALEKGVLIWQWAEWKCPLEHFEGDTFLANGPALVDGPAEFSVGKDGKVRSVKVIGRVFMRAADSK